MKRIFRSIINIKKNNIPTISSEELIKNYKFFLSSKIKTEDPSYTKMYHWIEAHFRQYRELPSIELLYEKAQNEGEEVILANLADIATQTPYIRSDYNAIIKEKFEEQSSSEFQSVLTKTWTIVSTGLKLNKKKELKGITNAIEFFSGEARKFRLQSNQVKTDSQIRSDEDCNEVIDSYKKRKRDPLSNMGLFTFLDKMDDCFRGTKLGDLLLIAAFVGSGKTTFAANLAYNGIMQGMNGMFVALEMNFEDMRDLFYTLHTCNPEWYDHPKYKHLAGKLSYEKVSYGELSDEEQEFFEEASKHFKNHEGYGDFYLLQPSESLTPSSLELEIYNRQAVLAEQGKSLDFVIVDYVGLMVQDKNERYGDFRVDLNNIIKKLKNLAMTFDNGRKLRVITPFQVNREGWKEAVKNDGVYKTTALSDANEAERTSDQIITLFLSDEMKKSGMLKIGCIKHRKGNTFAPFEAHIDFISRRIRDFIQKKSDINSDGSMVLTDIPLD